MKKAILIKLGGSVITDKERPFVARKQAIRRLGKEIKSAQAESGFKIILSHGGGSFPHVFAAEYQTQRGYRGPKSRKGLSLVADAAIRINRIVMAELLALGLPVVSFSPASFIYAENRQTAKFLSDPFLRALALGFIPVVYGDIVFDSKKGFCIFSGEKTLNLIASILRKTIKMKIIYCVDTDGVYNQEGRTIDKITPKSFRQFQQTIHGAAVVDVTGGMFHKVVEALKQTQASGIETLIINGRKKGVLERAILGKKVRGTLIGSD